MMIIIASLWETQLVCGVAGEKAERKEDTHDFTMEIVHTY